MLFDAATGAAPIEIDATTGSQRLGSAIGGDTVAYVDYGFQDDTHSAGELVIYDLANPGVVEVTEVEDAVRVDR